MSNKSFIVIVLLLLAVSAHALSGFEYQLDFKKKFGKYSSSYLSIENVIIAITKLNPKDDGESQDEHIRDLFLKGNAIWQETGAKNTYAVASEYSYKKLCDAVIGYYNSVGRVYKSVPYLRTLIDDSAKGYLVEFQADATFRLADIYLALGQTESAKELLNEFKAVMDDFFTVNMDNMSEMDPYVVTLNAEYRKMLIKLELVDGHSEKSLSEEQAFFDYVLKAYKACYYLPFMKISGALATEHLFIGYSSENITNKFFYTNYDLMYMYAGYFASKGDRARALRALAEAEKAVKANADGDLKGLYFKEVTISGGITATDAQTLQRLPLRFAYLESLYRSVVLSKLGEYDKASKDTADADIRYKEMKKYYSSLPAEYSYTDKIDEDLPQQMLSKAIGAKGRGDFASADGTYTELINYYEKVRESLPVQLRRGFFRGCCGYDELQTVQRAERPADCGRYKCYTGIPR
jgi:hypothetical protein